MERVGAKRGTAKTKRERSCHKLQPTGSHPACMCGVAAITLTTPRSPTVAGHASFGGIGDRGQECRMAGKGADMRMWGRGHEEGWKKAKRGKTKREHSSDQNFHPSRGSHYPHKTPLTHCR